MASASGKEVTQELPGDFLWDCVVKSTNKAVRWTGPGAAPSKGRAGEADHVVRHPSDLDLRFERATGFKGLRFAWMKRPDAKGDVDWSGSFEAEVVLGSGVGDAFVPVGGEMKWHPVRVEMTSGREIHVDDRMEARVRRAISSPVGAQNCTIRCRLRSVTFTKWPRQRPSERERTFDLGEEVYRAAGSDDYRPTWR